MNHVGLANEIDPVTGVDGHEPIGEVELVHQSRRVRRSFDAQHPCQGGPVRQEEGAILDVDRRGRQPILTIDFRDREVDPHDVRLVDDVGSGRAALDAEGKEDALVVEQVDHILGVARVVGRFVGIKRAVDLRSG